jgi:hypothetical protein
LIGDDRRQAGERDLQRFLMEDSNAEQRQAKQDEIDRNAKKKNRPGERSLNRSSGSRGHKRSERNEAAGGD